MLLISYASLQYINYLILQLISEVVYNLRLDIQHQQIQRMQKSLISVELT